MKDQFLVPCSGPREEASWIGSAGVIRRQAVDISPLRRVNQAIFLLTTGAREPAFKNIKTIAECLADELINAAKGYFNRYLKCWPLLYYCFLWYYVKQLYISSWFIAVQHPPCFCPCWLVVFKYDRVIFLL